MKLTENLEVKESYIPLRYKFVNPSYTIEPMPKYTPLNLIPLDFISTLDIKEINYNSMKYHFLLIRNILEGREIYNPFKSKQLFRRDTGCSTYIESNKKFLEVSSIYCLMEKNNRLIGSGAYCFFNTRNVYNFCDYYFYLGVETKKIPEILLSLLLGRTIKSEYLKFFINTPTVKVYRSVYSFYNKEIKPLLLKDNIEIIESDNINSFYEIKYPKERMDSKYFVGLIKEEIIDTDTVVVTPNSEISVGAGIVSQIENASVFGEISVGEIDIREISEMQWE